MGAEMAGIYTVREFATAIKPWLLEHLLYRTDGPVIYLDPDIEVHADISGIARLAGECGIVLTPHLLRPIPRDRKTTNETAILAAGIFNLGFIGVGFGAHDDGFLRFWQERLRRDGISDPERMRFVDQRWVDFIHCFPHTVLDDPGCNVAYWNVWGRGLSCCGENVFVDGRPLRFMHYSGFDPRHPELLSIHQSFRPRILLSEHPILRALCRSYRAKLLAEGYEKYLNIAYGWAVTRVGTTLDAPARACYRAALLEADAGDAATAATPPGPFDPDGGEAFAAWLTGSNELTGVARYLSSLCELNADLWAAYPHPLHSHRSAAALHQWALTSPDPRAIAARQILASAPGSPRDQAVDGAECSGQTAAVRSTSGQGEVTRFSGPHGIRGLTLPRPGINLIGYVHSEDGLGQVVRNLVAAAAAVGLPHSAHSSHNTPSSLLHQTAPEPGAPWAWDTNVFCFTADSLSGQLGLLPEGAMESRGSAGLWAWETDVFPERYHHAFDLVDEVWAPSTFIASALERTGRGPVVHLPMPVPIPTWQTSLTRQDLGLPEGFLVLYVFSWYSIGVRKNPGAAIDAFTRAFGPEDGAHLVLKSLGGEDRMAEFEALRLRTDRADIHFHDGPIRSGQLKAMIEHCNCYLSLHRSEGFGYTLAEAMALAKPVVATGWSGNLDFMDESTAHLIPADLVPIPEDVPVYGGSGRWAEPDIEAAAAAVRRVHDDPRGADAMGCRARAHLARTRSPAHTGRLLAEHAARLRRSRAALA
jgi:hypothetical protein